MTEENKAQRGKAWSTYKSGTCHLSKVTSTSQLILLTTIHIVFYILCVGSENHAKSPCDIKLLSYWFTPWIWLAALTWLLWSSRILGTLYKYRTFNLSVLGRNLIWAVLLQCSIFDWLSHSSCLTLLCGVAMLTLTSCHIPAQRWVKWFLFICSSESTFRFFSWQYVNVKESYPSSITTLKDFQNSSCNFIKFFLLPFKCWQAVLMKLFLALLLSFWL